MSNNTLNVKILSYVSRKNYILQKGRNFAIQLIKSDKYNEGISVIRKCVEYGNKDELGILSVEEHIEMSDLTNADYDIHNIVNQIDDNFYHKMLVLESGYNLGMYLIKNGFKTEGIKLIRRCITHDNSKFNDEELTGLSKIVGDINTMKDPNIPLDTRKKQIISIHWKNNPHHPEYHQTVNDMSILDILEMVCDCHARSVQFNTELIPYMQARQNNRFHFNEEVYNELMKYCLIITNLFCSYEWVKLNNNVVDDITKKYIR